MDTRYILLLTVLSIFLACDCEDEDPYGKRVAVEVPILSTPAQSSFTVGDTIWWSGDFSEQVKVENVEPRMSLPDFDFFALFNLQLLPEGQLITESAIDVFALTGDVVFRNSNSASFYEIDMVEADERYKFEFGIVLRQPGIYLAGITTNGLLYDFYEHPAMYNYDCIGGRREDFRIHYLNSSTNRSAYDSIFATEVSDALLAITPFERYAIVGSVSFVVTE